MVSSSLRGRTIVVGVTGGIAAYKAAALVSRLTQRGADVRVIMTESAAKFVAPLTFQTLSRNPVYTDTFDERDPAVVSHIDLADHADLFIVAPATANIIAKMAHGLADDMLSTTLLATTAPILVAPAMNVHMYAHPAVQANLRLLAERGVRFVEPGTGQLACGYVGKGRLAEPETIADTAEALLAEMAREAAGGHPLAGRRVIVTAGGTVERIDPVRYITNDSSGKMGIAIAEAARDLGADVTLIAARVTAELPAGVEVVRVESAEDMLRAVMERFDAADVVVKAAAVADYRPAVRRTSKMKKKEDRLTLELEKTPDILAEAGRRKTKQLLIGFAAETDDLEANAMDKLRRKNCDLIVANDVTAPGAGFDVDTNAVSVFDAAGRTAEWKVMPKQEIGLRLMRLAAERLADREAEAP
ncbi:phosphopantothenoylcysteine decarboxylase/phosphopantothenate--cysteine ligase [Thermobacillus composti KWC4]|uniref:Coenzyme A biosynthesis bifunctional protein CoaBC n=1 Tax=Thermobacillus composti (strain DSM 18247 / JCM 13945 / KWC4) TaxID=717605 RepID=L0EET5_THECK|nr:bifunctional phosphopantothenoylcysteine decarboxylase/phosphopantothenate--cysteine ligase CoaBC [Thermobacillus composti]AGA58307.1 phosphopantothenoylcysteine decarboxylase/phosphopantothenate--cysteine ligase [Thermobacillus composti KWC4]